jgi:hypothetical protein
LQGAGAEEINPEQETECHMDGNAALPSPWGVWFALYTTWRRNLNFGLTAIRLPRPVAKDARIALSASLLDRFLRQVEVRQ